MVVKILEPAFVALRLCSHHSVLYSLLSFSPSISSRVGAYKNYRRALFLLCIWEVVGRRAARGAGFGVNPFKSLQLSVFKLFLL